MLSRPHKAWNLISSMRFSFFVGPIDQTGQNYRLVKTSTGLRKCSKINFEYVIGIKYNWKQLILKPPKIKFELTKLNSKPVKIFKIRQFSIIFLVFHQNWSKLNKQQIDEDGSVPISCFQLRVNHHLILSPQSFNLSTLLTKFSNFLFQSFLPNVFHTKLWKRDVC